MIIEVEDTGGGRGMELLIVGAVSTFHLGIVGPAALADALELYVGGIEDAFLESLWPGEALELEAMLKVDFAVLDWLEALPVMGAEGTEPASPSSAFGRACNGGHTS